MSIEIVGIKPYFIVSRYFTEESDSKMNKSKDNIKGSLSRTSLCWGTFLLMAG